MNKTAKKLQKRGFRVVSTVVNPDNTKTFIMTKHCNDGTQLEAEVTGEKVNNLPLKEYLTLI